MHSLSVTEFRRGRISVVVYNNNGFGYTYERYKITETIIIIYHNINALIIDEDDYIDGLEIYLDGELLVSTRGPLRKINEKTYSQVIPGSVAQRLDEALNDNSVIAFPKRSGTPKKYDKIADVYDLKTRKKLSYLQVQQRCWRRKKAKHY